MYKHRDSYTPKRAMEWLEQNYGRGLCRRDFMDDEAAIALLKANLAAAIPTSIAYWGVLFSFLEQFGYQPKDVEGAGAMFRNFVYYMECVELKFQAEKLQEARDRIAAALKPEYREPEIIAEYIAQAESNATDCLENCPVTPPTCQLLERESLAIISGRHEVVFKMSDFERIE